MLYRYADSKCQQRHHMQLYKRQMNSFCPAQVPSTYTRLRYCKHGAHTRISAQLISFASPRFQQLPRYPQRICKIKTQVEERDKEEKKKKKYRYPVIRGNFASFISRLMIKKSKSDTHNTTWPPATQFPIQKAVRNNSYIISNIADETKNGIDKRKPK